MRKQKTKDYKKAKTLQQKSNKQQSKSEEQCTNSHQIFKGDKSKKRKFKTKNF